MADRGEGGEPGAGWRGSWWLVGGGDLVPGGGGREKVEKNKG